MNSLSASMKDLFDGYMDDVHPDMMRTGEVFEAIKTAFYTGAIVALRGDPEQMRAIHNDCVRYFKLGDEQLMKKPFKK